MVKLTIEVDDQQSTSWVAWFCGVIMSHCWKPLFTEGLETELVSKHSPNDVRAG